MHGRGRLAAGLLLCLASVAPGCHAPSLQERSFRTSRPFARSVYDAASAEERHYAQLAEAVEQPGHDTPEALIALAELAHRIGDRRRLDDPAAALPWFRDAAAYSRFALERSGRGEDPRCVRAQAIARHNLAVEQLVRSAAGGPTRRNPRWREALAAAGVAVAPTSPSLASVPCQVLWVAADVDVKDLEAVRWGGLGVPLVAESHYHDRTAAPGRFLPEKLKRPATGVVSAQGPLEHGAWRARPTVLGLHDPRREAAISLGNPGGSVALAGDLTTPLASQFLETSTPLSRLATGGLLRPDEYSVTPSILMEAPHEPGKIPVLFIHGLASNPGAWLKMSNRLQSDPLIRARYEFWYAYYPTGATLMTSATRIRDELHRLREAIDPAHADPALDQMVVVGHSLGGVLSKQLVQGSGRSLETGLLTRPIDQVRMSPATRVALQRMLYFEPEPSVRRVVFIAAPHRGSNTANRAIGRISSALVRRPAQIEAMHAEVVRENGAEVFTPEYRERPPSSIDNLEWNSPILRVLSGLPTAPGVPYHSIIATMFPAAPRALWTDGVVSYESAHRDGAASELIVRHNHLANEIPEASDEVRRILRLHVGAGG